MLILITAVAFLVGLGLIFYEPAEDELVEIYDPYIGLQTLGPKR